MAYHEKHKFEQENKLGIISNICVFHLKIFIAGPYDISNCFLSGIYYRPWTGDAYCRNHSEEEVFPISSFLLSLHNNK